MQMKNEKKNDGHKMQMISNLSLNKNQKSYDIINFRFINDTTSINLQTSIFETYNQITKNFQHKPISNSFWTN